MQSKMALITFMDDSGGSGRPDNSLPGQPGYPSQGLPPGAVQLPVFPFDPTRPDQGLPPSSGRPDQGLPGSQPGVDNTLPGSPAYPSQGLPGGGGHPSHQPIAPGGRFVVKWFACHGLILVPDNSLPPTPEPK